MDKTKEQAVLDAALAFAKAYTAYSEAFKRNGDMKRYDGLSEGQEPAPLHPETDALCKESNVAQNVLNAAAMALVRQ